MGMVDRGAQLDWLSQYPEEKEILLPPLTGMEVQADEVTPDQVRTLTMRLNITLRSMTLEQLEAARQKELGELAGMADKVRRHTLAVASEPADHRLSTVCSCLD
jgi:5-enolpyruvylshikimate-3-phosphate synthase